MSASTNLTLHLLCTFFATQQPTAASGSADKMPQLFVVDPCFKEQFSLPNATPEYQSLWNDLPDLFVGTAEQLVPVVELMCTQVSSRHPP